MAHDVVTFTTADGVALEGLLAVPPDAWGAAVICHPHPQFGGSMRAPLLVAIAEGLDRIGVAVLRFNFRGVERSGSVHADGSLEHLDVAAAVSHLSGLVPGIGVTVVGWSFGADLAATVDDAVVNGWILVAAPLRSIPPAEMATATDRRAKHLIVPEHDQFLSPEDARTAVADWPNTTVQVLLDCDHFLAGATAEVRESIAAVIRQLALA